MNASRIQMLGGFVVASIIMLLLTWQKEMNEGYFTLYLLASAGIYGYGRNQETRERVEEIRKDAAVATAGGGQ